MFTSLNKPVDAYNRVKLETGVTSANPHQLILMLYDGAIMALNLSLHGLGAGDIPKKCKEITRAVDIISQGLQSSLKLEEGGELGQRLYSLYDYMCNRLLHANLKNDQAAIHEVIGLLTELKQAWSEIPSDSAAFSGNDSQRGSL